MGEVAVQIKVDFHTITCGGCSMVFAVPDTFYRRCKENGAWFRCPNPDCGWNRQHYTETDVQRLRKEADLQRRRAESAIAGRRWAEERAEREKRRAAAARGQVTKLKKRAAAGVCPCCHRSFEDLRRHMEDKHPTFLEEDEREGEEKAS